MVTGALARCLLLILDLLRDRHPLKAIFKIIANVGLLFALTLLFDLMKSPYSFSGGSALLIKGCSLEVTQYSYSERN